jgi:hypothetical protein
MSFPSDMHHDPLDPNGKTVAANLSPGDRLPLTDRHWP